MDRREALEALVSLPAITRIASSPVAPTDVIVIEHDGHLSMEVAERLKAVAGDCWPGRKVLVLDSGLKLKVVAQ